MGQIGNLLDSVTKTNPGSSSLDEFLSYFSPSDEKWVQSIDPYNTFEVSMKFHPDADDVAGGSPNKSKQSALEKLGSSLESFAKSSVTNLANNVTGGLLGSIMNGSISITKQRDAFDKRGEETFMEYLAAANLLGDSSDGSAIKPLELNLGVYCQSVTIPSISNPIEGTSSGLAGDFPINGKVVKPDSNEIQMTILNTKVPLHERIFYPWLREVTLPYWSYQCQPYTTADITVDFTKHADMKYVFFGCRPIKIFNPQAKQQNGDVARDITFAFDYMIVKSHLKNIDSAKNKLMGALNGIAGAASGALNL